MVFPRIGAYIDRATGFKILQIWLVFTACIPTFCSEQCHITIAAGWSAAEFENLRRYAPAFEHKVVNTISPVCTSGVLNRKLHYLNHQIEKILGLRVSVGWMRRRLNNSTQVSTRHTNTFLNDAQRVCMRGCLIWIKRKPMHPGKLRVKKQSPYKRFK